jgi:Xaa-Pro aminopeptidase
MTRDVDAPHLFERTSDAFEPATYASVHLYGAGIVELLNTSLPSFALVSAAELPSRLRSSKTAYEAERVRVACRIAEPAVTDGARKFRAGLTETEAAAQFRATLSTQRA